MANESILRSVACLVDNIFILLLADRSVFHPSVMLSDNRGFLAPTPKQMNIEKFILFLHSGVNIPFTKTDCPVKRICFCVCWKYFGNSLRRPHKMKGEMWQYNNLSYIFRWESLLVENRLKIIVIVREQGEGILQSSYSVGKETLCFRASFPLLLL